MPYPAQNTKYGSPPNCNWSGADLPGLTNQGGRPNDSSGSDSAGAGALGSVVRGYATFNVDGVGPILAEIKGEAALAVGSEPGRPAER